MPFWHALADTDFYRGLVGNAAARTLKWVYVIAGAGLGTGAFTI